MSIKLGIVCTWPAMYAKCKINYGLGPYVELHIIFTGWFFFTMRNMAQIKLVIKISPLVIAGHSNFSCLSLWAYSHIIVELAKALPKCKFINHYWSYCSLHCVFSFGEKLRSVPPYIFQTVRQFYTFIHKSPVLVTSRTLFFSPWYFSCLNTAYLQYCTLHVIAILIYFFYF